jgi:hypothetical protein
MSPANITRGFDGMMTSDHSRARISRIRMPEQITRADVFAA